MSDKVQNEKVFYQVCLQEELARRVQRNSKYSLRAFAKALGISATALSRILSGQRSLSIANAKKILKALSLTPIEEKKFLQSILSKSDDVSQNVTLKEVSLDLFQIISDVHHYAILEICSVKNFVSTAAWIAKELDLTEKETQESIDRLLRTGLLAKGPNGVLKKTDIWITTSDKTKTSVALKNHQRQVLQKSIQALENEPIEKRSHSSMTMAIDPTKIELARRLIDEFTVDLCNALSKKNPRQVYELSISLFPIQKKAAS